MNPKVKKVLFILTFIPYAAVLFICFLSTFFGAEFFGLNYGLEGFLTGFLLSILLMTMVIPVIPACIVFHILCLLRKTVPFVRKLSSKKFAAICLILCMLAAAVPFIQIYTVSK